MQFKTLLTQTIAADLSVGWCVPVDLLLHLYYNQQARGLSKASPLKKEPEYDSITQIFQQEQLELCASAGRAGEHPEFPCSCPMYGVLKGVIQIEVTFPDLFYNQWRAGTIKGCLASPWSGGLQQVSSRALQRLLIWLQEKMKSLPPTPKRGGDEKNFLSPA